MEETTTNITVEAGETMLSLNVHVDGVAADNKAPILVTLPEITEQNLNQGNIHLYHVENGETVEMTRVSSMDELDAHNEFYYDPNTRTVTMALATFSEVAVVSEDSNVWKGNFDYSWYDAEKDEFEIFNADQLAAFGAIVDGTAKDNGKDIGQNSFTEKTIKLMADIDLGGNGEESDISFNPIGHGTDGKKFMGTFDGNGCTISNLYQNGWALGLTYSTAGGGLFAYAEDATFKNLTLDSAYIVMECIDMGSLVGYAYGNCHFENILVKNSTIANYNRYTGGVVGEVNGTHTFINVDVDADTTVSALWGTFDPGVGGIIGGKYGEASVTMKRCDVACKLDVYNDVTSAYQWYSYRRCGMLIGYTEESAKEASGRTVATANFLKTEDCTVSYGDWAKYTYCEFGAERYPFVRVEEGLFNGAYSNARYGNPVGKSGNKVSAEHDFTIEHHDGEAHNLQIVFNQLYGGGQGCYGGNGHIGKGVTVVDAPAPVEKFVSKVNEKYTVSNGQTVRLGDLFDASSDIPADQEIQNFYVHAFVTPATETTTARATLARNEQDWKESTLTFSGNGVVRITINDYYYCTPTIINISVGERVNEAKFTHAFPNTETYLYRIGNKNEVKLSSLFEENKDSKFGITDKVTITVEMADGTKMDPISANAENWKNQEIKMTGYTGLIKVTIKDDDPYCTPTELNLEVVNAMNATSATSATSNNVVLLNDCSFSSLEVKNGYTLYGNGFTMTCSSDAAALDMGYAFVTMENGTLDNVQIVCPNFSHSILYKSNYAQDNNPTDADGKRYYNIKSAVMVSGNSKIANSRISGGRAAVYATSGNLTIDNTTIVGGAAANIHLRKIDGLTLRDATLIQVPTKANVNDTSKTVMGFSVVDICDANGNTTPITLEGDFNQYAWAKKAYADYIPKAGNSALGGFDVVKYILNNKEDFVHNIKYEDGTTAESVNLGICYLPDEKGPNLPTMSNNSTAHGYEFTDVQTAYIYTIKNTVSSDELTTTKPEYNPTEQGAIRPELVYTDTNENRVMTDAYSAAKNAWEYSLEVDLDQGAYTFDFTKLKVQKSGQDIAYTVKGESNSSSVAVEAGTVTYTIEISNVDGKEEPYVCYFNLIGKETSKEAPQWASDENGSILSNTMNAKWENGLCVAQSYGGRFGGAAPALQNVYVRYYSTEAKAYKVIHLADFTPANPGKLNGSNNSYEIKESDFTLTLTGGQVHSGNKKNAIPVVVKVDNKNKLYFVAEDTDGLVNSGNSARNVPVTYKFEDDFGNVLTGSHTWTVAENKDDEYKYSSFISGTMEQLKDEGCVTADTRITMADGTQKRVEDLNVGDMVMAFNHVSGKFEAAPIIFNNHSNQEAEEYDVLHLEFNNGKDVEIVQSHGFFDMTLMQYVYVDYENYADFIGHEFYYAGNDGTVSEKVVLENAYIEKEVTRIYCPVTYFHMNSIAEGFLNTPNIPGEITGLVNYFEYDPDLKYNEEAMQRDIEKYGLYSYDDFKDYISEAAYNSSPSVFLKVAVGKGMITFEQILDVIEYLLAGSLIQ